MDKESVYQGNLKKKIKKMIPGSIVLKNDPNWLQGIPDLTILYKDKWAFLEVKRSEEDPHRPNQDYYVDLANTNSCYGAFIFPENEKEILSELQRALES